VVALPTRSDAYPGCPPTIAHRGVTQTGFTEESVNAEREAVTLGADYAEMDVQMSSNGVLYVMHDSTLDRTSNGTGPIRDLTSTQINQYRLNDGERIPHLPDVLDALEPSGIQAFVETKAPLRNYLAFQKRIREFGTPRVIINSFYTSRLDRVHQVLPYARLSVDSNSQVPVATAETYGSAFVIASAVTPGYVADLHTAGAEIYVFKVPETPTGYSSVPAAVDGIATNNVPSYRAWCATAA
jgi:glycerophosphoryl diester phosphodiesterase